MKYSKPIVDIIRARHSTRTYTGGTIDADAMQELTSACVSLNKAPLGERARFMIADRPFEKDKKVKLGDYGLQKNPRYFFIGAIKRSDTALEGYGFLLEHLVLKCTELGLGSCWMGYFNRDYFSDFKTTDDELFPATCTFGVPAESRRFGEKMMRSAIGADKRKDWKDIFFVDTFGRALKKDEAASYAEPLDMLRLAPSSGNTQPWRVIKQKDSPTFHFYLKKVKQDYYKAGMHNIDVGIAMAHFELTARSTGLDGEWRTSDPGLSSVPDDTQYRVSWIGK